MTAAQYNSISDNVLVLLLFRLHDRFDSLFFYSSRSYLGKLNKVG